MLMANLRKLCMLALYICIYLHSLIDSNLHAALNGLKLR
uniref:Uncharacterized protein n=1 Tax=Ciona intestinalis TaxID=7719 RepID=H2XN73_CIOIN